MLFGALVPAVDITRVCGDIHTIQKTKTMNGKIADFHPTTFFILNQPEVFSEVHYDIYSFLSDQAS